MENKINRNYTLLVQYGPKNPDSQEKHVPFLISHMLF